MVSNIVLLEDTGHTHLEQDLWRHICIKELSGRGTAQQMTGSSSKNTTVGDEGGDARSPAVPYSPGGQQWSPAGELTLKCLSNSGCAQPTAQHLHHCILVVRVEPCLEPALPRKPLSFRRHLGLNPVMRALQESATRTLMKNDPWMAQPAPRCEPAQFFLRLTVCRRSCHCSRAMSTRLHPRVPSQ